MNMMATKIDVSFVAHAVMVAVVRTAQQANTVMAMAFFVVGVGRVRMVQAVFIAHQESIRIELSYCYYTLKNVTKIYKVINSLC